MAETEKEGGEAEAGEDEEEEEEVEKNHGSFQRNFVCTFLRRGGGGSPVVGLPQSSAPG